MPIIDKPEGTYDVVVLGSGTAGIAAAFSAHDSGARVLVVEKAPEQSKGGNSRFSGGGFRIAQENYTADDFYDDLMVVTRGQGNKQLLRHMADRANSDVGWLQSHGLKFADEATIAKLRPDRVGRRLVNRAAEPIPFTIEGATMIGSGNGMVQSLHANLKDAVDIVFATKADKILVDEKRAVAGVQLFNAERGYEPVEAKAVVVATGGFQANPEMRGRYFGKGAVHFRLRGSQFNTGDGIRMATEIGAAAVGDYTDFHCAVIDARSRPVECGETNINTYYMGVLVDVTGHRFLDEGEDHWDKTYAKFGKAILARPGGIAHLIYDSKHSERVGGLIKEWPPMEANSLAALAEKLGVNGRNMEATVAEFNAAIEDSNPLDPKKLDGRATVGLEQPKSNWAIAIDTPPFYGITVTGGVTFTFGGLRTDLESRVLDTEGNPVDGLFAAGEIQGDFFYHNYPGGSSLVRCTVFGRAAGANAAKLAGAVAP